MTLKKIICMLLCCALILSLAGCGKKEKTQPLNTIPSVETAPQKNYTQDDIKQLYNAAVQKMIDSKSYHMSGSWNSPTANGDDPTSVVTSIDLKYQNGDKGPVGYFDCVMNRDGMEIPHTTYHEGDHYYFYAYDWKYYTKSNDYTDYYAKDFLQLLGDGELLELEYMDQMDGSVEIRFDIPMGRYNSPGILGILGDYVNENIDQDLLTISVIIDKDGNLTYFYMSFSSEVMLLDDMLQQTVIVSMTMDGYGTTTVQAPADLANYENNIQEVDPNGGQGQVGILTPEDVN